MNTPRIALSRRQFLVRAGAVGGAAALGSLALGIPARKAFGATRSGASMSGMLMDQDNGQAHGATAGVLDMEGDYYKPVRLPGKPNAVPQLTDKQIEEFERTIACPCPCTLDVFTCRTTDFACGNSPAVHRDVQRLVAGGYSADEIMTAMLGVYGNSILMAPPKKGFNLLAWFAPFAALGTGAVVVGALLRGWRRNARAAAVAGTSNGAMRMPDVRATDDEMARLQAALRDDTN